MKRSISIILVVVMLLALTACGEDKKITEAINNNDWGAVSELYTNNKTNGAVVSAVKNSYKNALLNNEWDTVSGLEQTFATDSSLMNSFADESYKLVDVTTERFASGEIDFNTSKAFLNACQNSLKFDGDYWYEKGRLAIEKINESKTAFEKAVALEKDAPVKAKGLYAKVTEDDTEHYEKAQEKIKELELLKPVIGIGDTTSGEHFDVTLLGFSKKNRVYESRYFYFDPGDGFQYVIINMEVVNTTDEDEKIWPASDLDYYADNVLYDSVLLGYTPPTIDGFRAIDSDDVIKPGRQLKGYVCCKIPKDAKHLEIEFDGIKMELDL